MLAPRRVSRSVRKLNAKNKVGRLEHLLQHSGESGCSHLTVS